MLGSFDGRGWEYVAWGCPWMVAGLVASVALHRPLDALFLGDTLFFSNTCLFFLFCSNSDNYAPLAFTKQKCIFSKSIHSFNIKAFTSCNCTWYSERREPYLSKYPTCNGTDINLSCFLKLLSELSKAG